MLAVELIGRQSRESMTYGQCNSRPSQSQRINALWPVPNYSTYLSQNFKSPKSQTLSQTPQHVETVFVCDFHDLCPQLSPREVSVKVNEMEFRLKQRQVCKQLTQGCYLAVYWARVKPATSRSLIQHAATGLPSHTSLLR